MKLYICFWRNNDIDNWRNLMKGLYRLYFLSWIWRKFFFFCSLTFSICVCVFLLVFSLSMIPNNDNDNDNDIESISWKMPEHVLTICLLIAIRKWILWKQDYFLHWYQVPAFNSASSSEQGTNVHNKSSGISVLLSGQPI